LAVALVGAIPWWAKIAGKLLLSRLPVPRECWRKLGIFQHGSMRDPGYALEVFTSHYARLEPYLPKPFVVLELGPGDSLASALVAQAYGASSIFLVDAGRFATTDVEPYRRLARILQQRGIGSRTPEFRSVDEMLARTNATYLTDGLKSLASMSSGRVDFVFSQAVLEHVPLAEFRETVGQLARIQKAGGVASHRVDLQDHLSHSLNSLRFSRAVWESACFAKSGFYTNRLRASEVLAMFSEAGHEILARHEDRWPAAPLSRTRLHPDFHRFSDEVLLIRGMDLVCRKRV